MAKQESADKIGFEKAPGTQGGWKAALISFIKFISSIIFLPLVIGLTKGFCQQLSIQEADVLNNFSLGLFAYLILHIFFYEPRRLYDFGQKIISRLFSFFAPLSNLLYGCLPVYATVSFVAYLILRASWGNDNNLGYGIFLISFFATMHLVLTAIHLREESPIDALRGNYFFSLFLVYIFEIILLAGFLNILLSKFSYIDFIKEGFGFFFNTLCAVWKQLFVLKGA